MLPSSERNDKAQTRTGRRFRESGMHASKMADDKSHSLLYYRSTTLHRYRGQIKNEVCLSKWKFPSFSSEKLTPVEILSCDRLFSILFDCRS